jgi:glycosyltransferase involved in cell wall biosynthesis
MSSRQSSPKRVIRSGDVTRTIGLLVTGSEAEGRRACARMFGEPRLVVTRQQLSREPLRTRALVRAAGLEFLVLHSPDWRRASLQPLFEVAAALLPARHRVVVIDGGEEALLLSNRRLYARMAVLPVMSLTGIRGALRERARFRSLPSARTVSRSPEPRAILAVWRGDPVRVTGGAVTHGAGILQGMRNCGVRVGLVTMCLPPPQLAQAADDMEIAAPLRPSHRVTREIEDITVNAVLRDAAEKLIERLHPDYIYQRYDAFVTCGIELAARHSLPLVLEWNGSWAWERRHWREGHYIKNAFERYLIEVERESLSRAVAVRAVSRRAAEMAVQCGADPGRVLVIPNAVDLAKIPAPVGTPSTSGSPEIGWVGSFGPWHGAPILIEAMPLLPEVRAVMIGEGAERSACMERAVSLGVNDRIQWTGALPHPEAIDRLSRCDLLASPHVPSDGQAFFGSPTKIFEYMAVGRPMVASRLEQLEEVLDDGRTAVLVRPGSVEDFARGVQRVLAMPDRGHCIGVAARAEAEAHHTWDARARDLLGHLSWRLDSEPAPLTSRPTLAAHP